MHRLLLAATVLCCGCLGTSVPPAVRAPVADSLVEEGNSKIARAEVDRSAVQAISYEDLDLPMQPDSLFEDWMLTQRVRDLDGRRVRITGFMLPGYDSQRIKNFMMLREKECPYGPGGQAHHAIAVALKSDTARYTSDAVTVEGTFSVRPFTGYNGKTWSVYAIDQAEVKTD